MILVFISFLILFVLISFLVNIEKEMGSVRSMLSQRCVPVGSSCASVRYTE